MRAPLVLPANRCCACGKEVDAEGYFTGEMPCRDLSDPDELSYEATQRWGAATQIATVEVGRSACARCTRRAVFRPLLCVMLVITPVMASAALSLLVEGRWIVTAGAVCSTVLVLALFYFRSRLMPTLHITQLKPDVFALRGLPGSVRAALEREEEAAEAPAAQ